MVLPGQGGIEMPYKAVPFEPSVAGGSTASVAAALEAIISSEAGAGWEYVALENHSTVVPGDAGCFGFGATAAYPKTFSVIVFRQ
ncbi:MAG: hypothetical protein Q7J28_06835 [Caulobacter sp.]|nr:hypothetical protein [Caulobacter sp.]